jgi:hypothetical protein
MAAFQQFIGGYGVAQSVIADCEDTVNYYVERINDEVGALLPTPGLTRWAQTATVGGRAFRYCEGRLFGLMGGTLYEFDSNGTATVRGAVDVDANPGQLIYGGSISGQLAVISGGSLWVLTLATNVFSAKILNGLATMGGIANGFGLVFNKNTGRTLVSAPNDLATYNLARFFARSLFADPAQTLFVDANGLVWTIGTETFEVREATSSSADQPFQPLSGLVGAYGIVGSFAFGRGPMGNFWLSNNEDGAGELVLTRGGPPQTFGNFAVNTLIDTYRRSARIDDAEMFTYQQGGHTFAIVHLPSAPATLAVDLKTQSWARRGLWNPNAARFELWSPRVHVNAFGKHLVADRTTGIVSELDLGSALEVDGTGIVRERTAPAILDEHKRHPIDQVELLMDVGRAGVLTGVGSNPVATLAISDDGGVTFGNARQAPIGRQGQWKTRVVWTRCGCPPHGALRVRVTDPAPSRIVSAFINNAEKSTA